MEWATANGWTVERQTWEMARFTVQSPEAGRIGFSDGEEAWKSEAGPGADREKREAWEDAWYHWEHMQREQSEKK